jgi:succinate dehydrogenase / fumarate reductase cytochrome b subunit
MNFGAYMWAAQRVTGLFLVFYLFLHISVLGSILGGTGRFDQTMHAMEGPVIKLLEVALLGVIFFHAMNGIRLILIHIFVELDHKSLAYGLSVATVLFVIFCIPMVY